MRMAATSAATFEKVAAEGLPLFVGLRGDGLSDLAQNIDRYRQAWTEAGHTGATSVYLRVPVYCADTEQSAHDEPRQCITYYFERQARLLAQQGAKRDGGNAANKDVVSGISALTYEDILATRVIFGSPSQIIERISAWRLQLGISGIVMELNAGGGLTEAQVQNSLRLVTKEVMPAFK